MSFVRQEQSILISGELVSAPQRPLRQSSQCRARCPTCTFLSVASSTSFLLANDLERDGSRRAKPQLSGRRSHRWARLSQLNPQAAGSDDAQDASYQQDVL